VTEVLVTAEGALSEPPVGAELSGVSVKVVSLALLPAASVPCAASDPVPLALVQVIAVES
jgi:hypothetical protein